jgi:hypothetical protein
MSLEIQDPRAQAATLVLQHTRAELRAVLEPPGSGPRDAFPRSATFRWLMNHLTPSSIASTVMAAALVRVPFGQIIGKALFGRKN